LTLPPVDDMRVDRATPAAAAAVCRAVDAATAKREIATVPAALDLQRGMDGCSAARPGVIDAMLIELSPHSAST
jgi:hypothetical protein